MGQRLIRIDKEVFRLVATLYEGQALHFRSGRTIAVEKQDMRPGGTEFDFQVNSRAWRDGRPENIMSTQSALDREFMENRVKSNILGLPVSVGNLLEMGRTRSITASYGELRPQVFRSRVPGETLAWRIWFKHAYYAGAASRPMLRAPTGAAVTPLATQAMTRAEASASAGAATSGRRAPGEASGQVQPLDVGAMLLVWARVDAPFQPLKPFETGDVIFRDPTLFERLRSVLGR